MGRLRRQRRSRRSNEPEVELKALPPGDPEAVAVARTDVRTARQTLAKNALFVAVVVTGAIVFGPAAALVGKLLWAGFVAGAIGAGGRRFRAGLIDHRMARLRLASARAHEASLPPARLLPR